MEEERDNALLGDVPVGETGRTDDLRFSATAEVLARAAIETKTSITIGVFGEWGVGKTSMMRLIKESADSDPNAVAVWFNAWQYEKEEHLIVPLVATINKELQRKLDERKWKKRRIAEGAKNIGSALRAVAYGFSVKGKIGIPLISEAEVNLSPKDMIERYQDLTKDSVLARSLYFDAFEKLAECAAESDAPRIVVFIDDLDRCFPDKAVELLEHIKLILHQPGFAFVLGVNDVIIEAFVRKKYEKEYKLDWRHSEDYLEKIVQVKIDVPRREPKDMKDYIEALLDESKVSLGELQRDAIPMIAEAGKRNPRSIVRFLNRVLVISRIGKLENREYDILALLIHEATSERRYAGFRKALDITVALKDKKLTIGEFLADRLEQYTGAHGEWIARLRETTVKSRKDELGKAIDTLGEYEYLCNLLRTDIGRKWLSKIDFRLLVGEVSESTVGERKGKGEREKAAPSEVEDPISQLQENMVPIPAGDFMMCREEGDKDERQAHKLEVEAFEIGAMPVTQAQYKTVMRHNPSRFKGSENPVEQVSWRDAMRFCEELSKRTSRRYTLPTEAQWEYACRAGSGSLYCFGDSEDELGDYAWYSANSGGKTHPVGRKKPNDWGLYDVHGNVWEWCSSLFRPYPYKPEDGREDPIAEGLRVLRGGSWINNGGYARCAYRTFNDPGYFNDVVGFRLVLAPSLAQD